MNRELDIWQKVFKGINNGRQAFCGPHTVQIDLTDRCNNTCIACWVHSPLIDEKKIFPEGEKELPFELVETLINQLHQLGTREIILSGSGEPLLYPQIKKVIRIIKLKKMYLNLITNAILIDEEMAKFLVKYKVDLVTASIWAGSSKAYIDTHPGKNIAEFERIKENLKRLSIYKGRYSFLSPHIKIYNVICSKNYDDIENMVNFAKYIDADSIEFQIVDIISDVTERLVLTDTHKQQIVEQLKNIRERADMVFFNGPKGIPLDDFTKDESLDFGKIWKDFKNGFYLSQYCSSMICKKGYKVKDKRIVVSESTSTQETHPTVFWYKFKNNLCRKCEQKINCLDYEGSISVKLMNILGVGSFLRRLLYSDLEKGIYENQIDSVPCYIGWYYARILTNGSVIPCCKASEFPLGTLYEDNFLTIWNSPLYEEFRFKAKNLPKTDSYFSKINCMKSCDNWGMNMEIAKRLQSSKKIKSTGDSVNILAKDFIVGNFNSGFHNFGKNLIIDGGEKKGFARYEFTVDKDDDFELWSRYASSESRPVDIYMDSNLIKRQGLNCITGGWNSRFLKWDREFDIKLRRGNHVLEIYSLHCIPHIEKFAFFRKGYSPDFLRNEEKNSYFKMFKQSVSKKGLKETFARTMYNLTPRSFKNRYLQILGIYDGEYGYKGPFHVQIDLTNNCNSQCIACWCHSPLLGKNRLLGEEKKQYLPLRLVKETIDEFYKMGATEIYYSGSGEPFMHPDIMEILKYTKQKKGIVCHVNTNFTLLDKDKIDSLINLGVDFLTVSVWAGSPQNYSKVHLPRTEEDFYKIKENLIYLNRSKKEKFNKPLIKIYPVLFNMNYFEVEKMIEFAESTKSESIEFTLADIIPNKTDILRLNEAQVQKLIESCKNLKKRLDKTNRLPSGLLLFQFDQFLRRISVTKDVQEAKYDRNIIDSMPCYIGWLFARVVPNGEVHPCLKAHRISTGSLYQNNFSEIWNSDKQKHFRRKTLVYEKNDSFFRLIGNDSNTKEAGCYKSCDDIGRNTWMHNRINMLSLPEKIILKGTTKTMKALRKLNHNQNDYTKYHKDPLIAGIIQGRHAFVGPEQIVIDPTNRCNLKCISCWLYSPLLKKDKPCDEWLKKKLPKDVLIRLIDDLSSLKTKRIRFTGGGEPFMHNDLMEIIEYARGKGLLVSVTTNFGLVSEEVINRLIDLEIEELTVSIWASNEKVFKNTHPGVSNKHFENLKKNLLYLKSVKHKKPKVTFANVIMNTNFTDFTNMYKFGNDFGADSIYFTIMDVFSQEVERLSLNSQQKQQLFDEAQKIRKINKQHNIRLEFFDGFIRRLSTPDSDFKKGEYDKDKVNKIPCYAGWIFSRILANGDVAPCCRGVKKIMGNINRQSFKNIWFSSKYDEFRARAKYQKKDTPYFKEIGCMKECDNLMHNEEIHKVVLGLGKR